MIKTMDLYCTVCGYEEHGHIEMSEPGHLEGFGEVRWQIGPVCPVCPHYAFAPNFLRPKFFRREKWWHKVLREKREHDMAQATWEGEGGR